MDEWKRTPSEDDGTPKNESRSFYQNLSRLGKKKEILLIFLVFIGIMALLWPEGESVTGTPYSLGAQEDVVPLEDIRHQLTAEVQEILSGIAGIGKVEVCLTLDSDGVREYAFNQTEETRENREPSQDGTGIREEKTASVSTDVAVSGGNALLVGTHYPSVVGVLVVAEGASDAVMQQKICDAVAVLLDISPHRVRVLAGREENV